VHVDQLSIGPAQAGLAQETLSLSFQTVQWQWQVGTGPATVVSYDSAGAVSGGTGVKSFTYAYFAPGVAPDTTYLPISGYTHNITCPPSAKCTQGALSVQKTIGSETLNELGLVASGTTGLSVQLSWFTAAGTASNQILLAKAFLSGVSVTSNDDGTFAESVDFNYAQITWKAGATQATFDATAAQSI
jgi:type VI protein secretion system component Hcp